MKICKTTILILVLVFISTLTAQKINTIDELINVLNSQNTFSGVILVKENGKTIYSKYNGISDNEKKSQIDKNTKFIVASISKFYTTIAALRLVEENKLKLTDKLIDFTGDYKVEGIEKVTIHHLLTNSSGIPDFFSREYMQTGLTKEQDFSDLINLVKDKQLEFEPGSKFRWSNFAWVLLGKVIEKAGNDTYENLITKYIITPLKLENTVFCRKGIKNSSIAARGYSLDFDSYTPDPEYYFSNQLSADGIVTTAEDLEKFCREAVSGNLLKAQTKELLLIPYIQSDNRVMKYAYGCYIGAIPDTKGVKHNVVFMPGGMQGFQAQYFNVDNRYSVVILANRTALPLNEMRNGILNILAENETNKPLLSLIPEFTIYFREKGIDAVVERITELFKNNSGNYNLTENHLNLLGYQFLNKGYKNEAIKIFKLIVEKFPDSWNAYDSLGEAYLTNNNKEDARLNYKKSLELNPDNKNALEIIKQRL